MTALYYLTIGLHVVACLFLIGVVLLQQGKGQDLASAFGGGGTQTAFGPRGSANVLSRATTILAGLFMVTSLALSMLRPHESSILDRVKAPPPVASPGPAASPVAAPAAGESPAPSPAGVPRSPAQQSFASSTPGWPASGWRLVASPARTPPALRARRASGRGGGGQGERLPTSIVLPEISSFTLITNS